jgi:hypothetical protein
MLRADDARLPDHGLEQIDEFGMQHGRVLPLRETRLNFEARWKWQS